MIVNPAGDVVSGERGPTSEKYLHIAVQAAYEDFAVCIHSHAVHATMFAVAHEDIPSCIDEFTVYLGGDIRCSEYAASGSPELAEQVVKALESRSAALIANHGMVAIGTTMEKAMHNTALVERSAKIIWGAKQLGGIFPLPEKVNANFSQLLALHAVIRGQNRRPARRAGPHVARAASAARSARRRGRARRCGAHFRAAAPHCRGTDVPRATGRYRDDRRGHRSRRRVRAQCPGRPAGGTRVPSIVSSGSSR